MIPLVLLALLPFVAYWIAALSQPPGLLDRVVARSAIKDDMAESIISPCPWITNSALLIAGYSDCKPDSDCKPYAELWDIVSRKTRKLSANRIVADGAKQWRLSPGRDQLLWLNENSVCTSMLDGRQFRKWKFKGVYTCGWLEDGHRWFAQVDSPTSKTGLAYVVADCNGAAPPQDCNQFPQARVADEVPTLVIDPPVEGPAEYSIASDCAPWRDEQVCSTPSYTIPIPGGWQLIAAAKSGDRIAYLLYGEHHPVVGPPFARFLPRSYSTPSSRIELWARPNRSGQPHVVGALDLKAVPNARTLFSQLQWLPGGSRLSFIYNSNLYVISSGN